MLSLVLCVVLAGQAKPIPAADAKELSPSTRPVVELPLFRKMKAITASEYTGLSIPNYKKTRVYRYTYPAKFAEEVKRWKTLFPAKDGWKVDEKTATQLIISRKMKSPVLLEQALILHSGKIFFDAKSRARTGGTKDENWVWISFNELFRK